MHKFIYSSRTCVAALSLALITSLSACGGGGNTAPPVSAPPPAPSPTPTPTPTPTPAPPPVISDLKQDNSFNVASGNQVARFDLGPGITLASQSSNSSVRIDYDVSADRYTLTSDDGRSASFAPADAIETGDPDLLRFRSGSELLTLAYEGYGSALKTQSVALGFWQSNRVEAGIQDTDFDVFVYGFPSAASAVPKTGSADFRTDIFGFSSQVGIEPLTFQGTGTTTFDFARSTFEMDANISEYFLATGAGRFGALYLRASGTLSSNTNAFAGNFLYDGSSKSVSGQLSGSFFGLNAQEAGGIFSGDDGLGNSVVGAFTAALSTQTQQNLSVYNLRFDELFYTGVSNFERRQNKDGSPSFSNGHVGSNGQVSYDAADESYRYAGYTESEGRFTPSDIVSPALSEFKVYRINAGAEDIELALYQPANGGQVALTYSGFGVYRRTFEDEAEIYVRQDWFLYGLDTLEGVLAARTGTGTYNGIARGVAASNDGLRQLDVVGTSQFVIDFASQGYSGWLRLQGSDVNNGSTVDFGQFDLTPGNGYLRNAFTTGLQQAGSNVGDVQLRFYGPTGEELAGVFGISTDDFAIAGATAARR